MLAIVMSCTDFHILRLSHGPDRVPAEIVNNGHMTREDCFKIWPGSFAGNLNTVVCVLRDAGYTSVKLTEVTMK